MTLLKSMWRSTTVLFAVVILLHSAYAKAEADNYDGILAHLKKDDWQSHFSSAGERARLSRSYGALLALTGSKGINWRIRIRGIILLSLTGNPERVNALIRMYHDPFFNAECPSIKSSIITALGNIENDPAAVDTVIEGMNDPEIIVRETAVEVLGKFGNARAVPSLIAKLNDPSFAIKLTTIRSLAKIKDRRAVPYLQNMANNDREGLLRREALSAIDEISS